MVRTWTATDACGNSSTASETIHVLDNTAPVFNSVPAPSTINCPATPVFAVPTAVDACGSTFNITHIDVTTPGPCAGKYSVTRTWTATDGCGNSSTISQTIHVQDVTGPVITLAPVKYANCPNPPAFDIPVAVDACQGQLSNSAFTSVPDVIVLGACPGTRTITRVWTATDACGNTATASQVIYVQDVTAPTITSCPATRNISGTSNAAITSPVFSSTLTTTTYAVFNNANNAGTATDACNGVTSVKYIDNVVTTCPRVINRTWIVGDCSGNTTSCVQTINVNYTTPPSSFSQTACDSYTWNAVGTSYTTSGSYAHTFTNAAGCDSVITLNLTINYSSTNGDLTTSACNSYLWNGTTYTTSGTYTYTTMNASNCVNTATLNLTVNYNSSMMYTAINCDTYNWSANGVTYTNSGTYIYTSVNAGGCLNTDQLNLTINNSTSTDLTTSACDTYNWSTSGQNYASTGNYYVTSVNAAGCTHTDNLHLTINNSTSATTAHTACDSYVWNGNTYTTTGTYSVTSLNAAGCTHTDYLNLTINYSTGNLTNIVTCDSYTWSADGQTYTASGSYVHTNMNNAGCLNTDNLTLTINYSTATETTNVACDSYTWPANGQTYTLSGIYTKTSMNASNCVYTETLNLTVNYSSVSSPLIASACDSYTWAANGSVYTTGGTYIYTSLNASGCTNVDELSLFVYPNTSSTDNVVACGQYVWSCNSAVYTTSGSYTCTYQNAFGCTHTSTLNLTMSTSSSTVLTATACNTYTWNGQTYSASGAYTFITPLTGYDCNNVDTLYLTINYGVNNTIDETACDVYNWSCNGTNYNTSGTYTCSYLNDKGCVNTDTLNLLINNSSSSSEYITSCDNYTWTENGVTYTVGGTYSVTSINAAGCTYTKYLNLTINNSSSNTTTTTSCNNYPWSYNNVTYSVSGVYTVTSTNAAGCTHSEILNLTINNSTSIATSETRCDTYTWGITGQQYTQSGIYTKTSTNNSGCVHTDSLYLTINQSTSNLTSEIVCDSYTWNAVNGNTYTASGTYTETSLNPTGCTHTESLNLIVNNSTSSTSAVTACISYTWSSNGQLYTTGGSYVSTSINAAGCTHTDNLNLAINNISSANFTASACDSYTWNLNGQQYSTSGVYTMTSTNNAGCIHTNILTLTINNSTTGTTTDTACDSYNWSDNGQTYTASGIYTATSLNASGCVHTQTLNLTVNYNSTNGDATQISCNSFDWNGSTYTSSGAYTYTSMNASNCLNTATLTLTVNYSNTGSSSESACDSYTWTGTTYTNSGNYVKTFTNVDGCDSVHTLNLTVNYSSTNGDATQTVCNSLDWNGATYTASGVYTYTSMNASNCLNTATLTLTVNYSNTGSSSEVACDSFTWTGTTYTSSGTYVKTFTNVSGCDSVHTLNLTVNYSSSATTSDSACDTYTWSANSQTYTTSGVYTTTWINGAGCTHTQTLNLTVNYSTSGTTPVTICDTYTWANNGQTYTTSGNYTHTSTNASGCTHTETLALTVNYSTTGTESATSNLTYTWPINGQTYTVTGTYTGTSLNASACTLTTTLNLTIIGVRVNAKVLLEGAYLGSGMMYDSLRSQGLVPTTEPYTGTPYSKLQIGGPSGETTTAGVLSITGSNAVVDWVFLEIRNTTSPYAVIANKRALVQADGDIVDVDGVSAVSFGSVTPGNYLMSVKHRNHLGVMSSSALALGNVPSTVDFRTIALWTKPAIPALVNTPAKTVGGLQMLWTGDANTNKNTKYNGYLNDKEVVLSALGGDANGVTTGVYRREDVNMDGTIRYNGLNNDRNVILGTVGVGTPNNIYNQHTPD